MRINAFKGQIRHLNTDLRIAETCKQNLEYESTISWLVIGETESTNYLNLSRNDTSVIEVTEQTTYDLVSPHFLSNQSKENKHFRKYTSITARIRAP